MNRGLEGDSHRLGLDEVLADYLRRVDRGERVDQAAFVATHPELADELREYFSHAAAFDGAETAGFEHHATPRNGGLEVRCPNCHQPTEVAVDTTLTDLTCSACGSHFSLVDQSQATRMAPSLTKLGRFELIERLGVGGFGSVWKARDKELDRTVAIKIPRAGGMTSEDQDKFFREARAAAQLRHPSIVSVHEVGRDGDSVYIVSDFVRGVTLGDWLTAQKLTSREAAELGAKIADALQHAHEQGVVHRDLKPANIMIDGDGGPHLMDFGLARRETGEITVTVEGQVLGTPAYMSPEQAQGEAHTADRRSDVYSLGVILFQLLTGELPFRGNARMLIHQVINDSPPSPRKLNSNVPKDLETVALKCLEKEPACRYESAKALADDFRCFLRSEPIHARPVSRLERALRWVRRNKTVSAVSALAVLALIGGTVASALFAVDARQSETVARNQTTAAIAAATEERKAKETAVAREAETAAVLEFVETRILAAARPQGQKGGIGREVSLRQAIDAAIPHLKSSFAKQPLVEGRLRGTLGASFLYLGEPTLAAEQFVAARQLFTQHLGPDHPDTLRIMNNLATSYHALGRHEEALKLCDEVLALRKSKLGPDHPDTLASMANLANSYAAFGRHGEALMLREETLALQKAKLGPNHPDTLASMNNLANSYYALGRYAEALTLSEETLALQKAALGQDHADTLGSMNNLAAVCYALGRHEEALKLREETLALQKAKLGPNHPDTLASMNNLASSYAALGRHGEALKLFEEALALWNSKFGRNHPGTRRSTNELANSYEALGRDADALELRRKSPAHGKTQADSFEYLLRDAQPASQAQANYLQNILHLNGLKKAERLEQHDDSDMFTSTYNLANSCYALGRHEEAFILYEETLSLQKSLLGPGHLDTLGSMNSLARILATSSIDKLRDGERAVELATAVCKSTNYKNPAFIDTLAAAYAEAGDYDSAVKWSEESLGLLGETGNDALRKEFARALANYKTKKPTRHDATPVAPASGATEPSKEVDSNGSSRPDSVQRAA